MPDTHTATARFCEDAELFGLRPGDDEIDTRPMPEEDRSLGAVHDMVDAVVATLQGTRMEPDIEELVSGIVNVFHRYATRLEGQLDRNELDQRAAQERQDGSEVAATELEKLIAIGRTMIERRNWMEAMRDEAAELFEVHTGSVWRPRTGSQVNNRHMTAAYLDSKDFIAARRTAQNKVMVPTGTKIAVIGGPEYQDVDALFNRLDLIRKRYPDMVLLHGGAKGAELIADRWAANRGVTRIPFKPDWNRHKGAAPFKRNDQLLAEMPQGVMLFDGGGVIGNLFDGCRRRGISVWDLRTEEGA